MFVNSNDKALPVFNGIFSPHHLGVITCSGSQTVFNKDPNLNERSYNLEWMKSIPEETPLSAIAIPGTHESLTLYKGLFASYLQSQVWSLKDQLNVGVRYFDLHSRNWIPKKIIYVGDSHWLIGKEIPLGEVLRFILDFLEKHSSETVILKVTLHDFIVSNKKNAEYLMNEIIDKFRSKIWTNTLAPKMKDARGKIVFLKTRVFQAGTESHDSHFFEHNRLINVEKKIKNIKSNLCKHHIMVSETPKTFAQNVNKWLYNFVERHKKISKNYGCLGVISMNFPSTQLIKNIIQKNVLSAFNYSILKPNCFILTHSK
uniref:Phosphatidylinositol-specific phospholipase C X domain-containing protein n=1 Tax=Oreochromis niloticus TaxID=8128 RepID=A0A669BHZ9_ORENI